MSTHDHDQSYLPKLLSQEEAAAYLRKPVATLQYWRWAGKGPKFIKIGSGIFYRQDRILEHLNELESSSTSESAMRRAVLNPSS